MKQKTKAQLDKDRQKKIESQKRSQEKARQKQIEKQRSPEFKEAQRVKVKASFEKQIKKQQSPEFKEAQRVKIKTSFEKQIKKQQSPEFKEAQRVKIKTSFEKQILKQDTPEEKPKKIANQNKPNNKPIRKMNISTLKTPKQNKELKRTSTKGKARKTFEIELHNKLASIGCICCINLGLTAPFEISTYVSIHHTNGRTKESSHEECLPLCAGHHDTPLPTKVDREANPTIFPIHAKGKEGGKSEWERQNGTQKELVIQCWNMINYLPVYSKLLEESADEFKKAS
jgi:hypothetical protein